MPEYILIHGQLAHPSALPFMIGSSSYLVQCHATAVYQSWLLFMGSHL